MEDIVLYYACKFFGDWERIYDAIEEQQDVDFEEVERLKEELVGKYITVYDPAYPPELRSINRPPFVLFYKGEISLLTNKNKLWMYGSYFDEETEVAAIEQNSNLKEEGFALITGYSSEFERKNINSNPPINAIIVRDCGIDSHINMTKIEEGAFLKENIIISEYPDKVIPSLYTWEMSNRIKGGLSNKLYLLNSSKDAVTFRMISETINDKKDVFCYNEDVSERSHNTVLISKGAYAIDHIKELKN